MLVVAVLAGCENGDRCDGVARGLCNSALEKYSEMRFSKAYAFLDSAQKSTNNQVELMVADVVRMKISQRTAELRTFYRSWHSAENRLARICQERGHLDSVNLRRAEYAECEMHTIAATYYYYMRMDSLSRLEMKRVAPIIEASHDTMEWVQYLYMMGSGGMVSGDSAEIRLEEFDYLLHALTVAHRSGNRYFEANALQSLALNLETKGERKYIRELRNGGYEYLLQQHLSWMQTESEDSLPIALIRHSYILFEECGDIFQQANVLRTESELFFNNGEYGKALLPIKKAERIIEEQHLRDSLRVPYWEAKITERLSLTYSALGKRQLAEMYRSHYLILVDQMSQDLEEEARAEDLAEGNLVLYIRLGIIVVLALVLAVVFWLLLRGVRRRGLHEAQAMRDEIVLLRDERDELSERLKHEKLANIERRSKVALAESVVPYINRMLNTDDMVYVGELADRIMLLNGLLTEWIQVRSGRLSMNISSFALQPLFDVIGKNGPTFRQQGLKLDIKSTDLCVKADRVLTLFMLNTLADNARKFTPMGGSVSIDACAHGDEYVELSVSDTGYGLCEEDVDTLNNSKVWNAKRLGTDHKECKGFGFGLMNCKGIISQMRKASSRFACCSFGVESRKGEGSRFWFRLPRVACLVAIVLLSVPVLGSSSRDLRLRMESENELAIRAELDCRWEDYRVHNHEFLALHRQLTADPNLPLYAERLHQLENEANWALIFTGVIVLSSLFVFAMIVRVSRHRRRDMIERDDELTLAHEQKDRVQFELDRIHVSNQILDNCLSTIKHETMYYPARIRQMVDGGNRTEELSEVTQYYYEMYSLLLAQAERETKWRMPLDGYIMDYMKNLVQNILRCFAEKSGVDSSEVIWDKRVGDKTVTLNAKMNGVKVPDGLFTAEFGVTDALILKEIIRLHDAASGHPGLRLCVENNEISISLWKNSKLLS